jgi:hypothetical protein
MANDTAKNSTGYATEDSAALCVWTSRFGTIAKSKGTDCGNDSEFDKFHMVTKVNFFKAARRNIKEESLPLFRRGRERNGKAYSPLSVTAPSLALVTSFAYLARTP